MPFIVSSIAYIKGVSSEKTCTSITYSRVDNDGEFVKINFKVFGSNNETMVQEIKTQSYDD